MQPQSPLVIALICTSSCLVEVHVVHPRAQLLLRSLVLCCRLEDGLAGTSADRMPVSRPGYSSVPKGEPLPAGASTACRAVLVLLPWLPQPLLAPIAEQVLLPALALALQSAGTPAQRTDSATAVGPYAASGPSDQGSVMPIGSSYGAPAGGWLAAGADAAALHGLLLAQAPRGGVARSCLHHLGFALGVEEWRADWRATYGRSGTSGGDVVEGMLAVAAAPMDVDEEQPVSQSAGRAAVPAASAALSLAAGADEDVAVGSSVRAHSPAHPLLKAHLEAALVQVPGGGPAVLPDLRLGPADEEECR